MIEKIIRLLLKLIFCINTEVEHMKMYVDTKLTENTTVIAIEDWQLEDAMNGRR